MAKLYQYYKASILLYQAHHIFFTVKALSTIHDTESEMLQNHEYSLYSDVEEKRLDFLRIIELQSVSLLCYIAKVEDNEEQKEKKWDLVLQDINTGMIFFLSMNVHSPTMLLRIPAWLYCLLYSIRLYIELSLHNGIGPIQEYCRWPVLDYCHLQEQQGLHQ